MSTFALAATSSVLSAEGPIDAAALRSGSELHCLGRTGSLVTREVLAVGAHDECAGVRLICRSGDTVVPGGVRLAGSRGPVLASAIKPGSRQLESLKPGQAAVAFPSPRPLDGLAGKRMITPSSEVAAASLQNALDEAGVRYSVSSKEEWTIVDVEKTGLRNGWSWDDEVELLRLLTMWTDGESRTVLTEVEVRRRLLWAMTAAGQPFDARWVPAYRPVECRVTTVPRTEAFTSVVRAEPTTVECRTVEVDAAALIVDRVYVLPSAERGASGTWPT